jgi:hypothetical protein
LGFLPPGSINTPKKPKLDKWSNQQLRFTGTASQCDFIQQQVWSGHHHTSVPIPDLANHKIQKEVIQKNIHSKTHTG